MSTLTEFDIAPLSWIREEIDHALTQVREAISQQSTSQIGPSELRLARTYLHQITGALEMVGLRGTALVCHEAENLAQRLEQSPQEINPELLDVIRITGETIAHYLDDLLSGKPNIELQLLPVYQQLREGQGITQTRDSDLFFPNVEARPIFQTRTADLTKETRIRQYKMARAQFERGLLDFLRQQSAEQGLANMREAASIIESAMDLPATRTFWWGVTAFIDSLITHSIEPGFAVKQLCGRIDLQLKRHIQGSNKIAERLMRDMLYFIANSRDGSERIIEVKNTFELSRLLPKQLSKAELVLHEQLESGLQLLQQSETAWDAYLSGNHDSLSEFKTLLQTIQTLAPTTQHKNIHALIAELHQVLNDLPEIAAQRLETLYLEITTILFLLENYFAHYESVQDEMRDQADYLKQRLHAAAYSDIALTDINASPNTSMLDSIARQAQEKVLVAQIAQEIQVNLDRIEESLDHFFRSPDQDRQVLDGAIKAIHEISGALSMMQWDQASQVLQAGQKLIAEMADPTQVIDEKQFPLVAEIISAIGLYVDAERFQQTQALSVLHPILIRLGLAEEKVAVYPASEHIEDDLASLKTELAQQLGDLQQREINEEFKQKLTDTLKKIKQDADLVGDLILKSQMEAALQQLADNPVIERITELLSPVCNMSLNTSVDTSTPTTMSSEQINTEIFETFLEEAKEVLSSIKNELQYIENSTEQQHKLKEIRRGFHTLKGGGRMAHLNELGETAWAIEQLLNQWLQQALNPTDELLKLLQQATLYISTWIDSLSTGALMDNSYHDLIAHADQIRTSIENKLAQQLCSIPPLTELPAPSFIDARPEDTTLIPSTTETNQATEIDAEILEVFLEEASEVLFDIAHHLEQIESSTEQHLELKEIRRGFHTIKGSGRMVHLHELGETAWAVEQLLNQWLQHTLNPTNELLKLLQQASLHISTWVDSLTAGEPIYDGYQNIIERANQLRAQIGDEDKIEMQEISVPIPDTVSMTPWEDDQSVGFIELALTQPNIVPDVASVQEQTEISSEISLTTASDNVDLHDDETEKPAQETVPHIDIDTPTAALEPESANTLIRIGLNELPLSLFEIYQHETSELLHTLRHQFELCSTAPYPPVSPDFMRASHTLAGISRLTGFHSVGDLSFAVETWLTGLLNHQLPLPEYRHELAKACIERLTSMLTEINSHIEPEPAPDLIEALQQAHFINEQHQPDSTQAPHSTSEPESEPPAPVSDSAITIQPDDSAHSLSSPLSVDEFTTREHSAGKRTAEKLQTHESTLKTSSANKKSLLKEEPVPLPHSNRAVLTEPAAPFTDDVDEQLLAVFLEEALDLMPDIERTLHEWQRTPGSTAPKSQLLRLLHTLKGSARMAGAMHLGDMSHEFEADVLFHSDNKQASVSDFETFENHLDQINIIIERLRHPHPSVITHHAAEAGDDTDHPSEVTAHTAAIANKEVLGQTLRIPSSTLDRIVNEVGEISITRSRLESTSIALRAHNQELFENTERLRAQLRELDIQAESQMQSTLSLMRNEDAQFDPLEFDRFTRLQELTRMITESVNDIQTVQQNVLVSLNEADAAMTQQGRLSKSVQQTLMHIRMVPLSSLADRLHRTVRVAGKDLGKKVSLQLTGKQIEFDGNMLNKLVAPLEHLLRNAVAHGIELPEQRLSANKSEYGEIVLTAKQSSNEMVITVRDDGRGLDFEAIRSQALKNGLIQTNDQLSEDDLAQIIFTSGFSTTENVSTLSGRGVGMDVVKNEITRMGGRIELHSTPEGLLTTLYLPLILAVTQAVLVTVNERTYAIDSSIIDQVQVYKPEALKTQLEQGEITWLENTYPLFYLPQLLEDSQSQPLQQPRSSVLLLRNGNNRVAILVDSMTRNQEIVVKNIGSQLTSVPGIAGATVLGNGQVVLILNPVQLVQQAGIPSAPLVGNAPSLRRTIMVVDDSLTVRKITSRLLQREGYDVVTAKDGLDALQMLQQHKPDLMLLDIEMPRMDGFELTKVMRSDEHMVNIPIIMITSRTATKHRELAASLGVNAYMGKPFQEDSLLAKIAELIKTTNSELT
ncbi:MAG: Hpt domain-containing protein [Betaproteobacteria bacterium]|nr:Hpt domain-containing protein [Betaproteobacteria bacterium]